MDLGLAFEDDDLNITEDKSTNNLSAEYNVKLCIPQWFEEATQSWNEDSVLSQGLDKDQIPHTFKFNGDFQYYKKNYEKAAELYKQALDLLPENNVSVRQDVQESLCRCYLYCGRTCESLQMARAMVLEMSNENDARQRQALILMTSVCTQTERWAECVKCLEKLCLGEPCFAQWWDQLGDAYMKLDLRSPQSEVEVRGHDTGDRRGLKLELVKPLTCYIRASLLLKSVLGTAGSFIKNRNQTWLEEITKKIDSLPFSNDEKEFAFQHIQEEIEFNELQEPEINKEMPDTVTSGQETAREVINTTDSSPFYSRFFSWFKKCNL